MKGEIIAIVITFNPNIKRLNRLLKELSRQADTIYIVDNNSKNGVEEFYNDNKIQIEVLEENKGIAYAQNIGIQKAIAYHSDSYTIFFDQDSSIDPDYIKKIYQSYLELGDDVGLIGPALYNDRDKYFYPVQIMSKVGKVNRINILEGQKILTNFIISSGSFLRTNIFKRVGLMKTYFFIDDVDTEFAFRLSKFGYKNYIVSDVLMDHNIGDNSIQFLKKHINIHNPLRRYYMLRNLFLLYKLDYFPILYIFNRFVRFIFTTILILLVCTRKSEYIKSFFNALRDGILYDIKDKN